MGRARGMRDCRAWACWWTLAAMLARCKSAADALHHHPLPPPTALRFSCDRHTSPPNHFIYCSGRILQAVMHHHLFADSKTFTELPLKLSPAEVRENFEKRFPTDEKITKNNLKAFLREHFHDKSVLEPGRSIELEMCVPEDWKPFPARIGAIQDPAARDFALHLHQRWPDLCRRVRSRVEARPDRFSLIHLKRPFIVPGGRFREIYYWDSLWTIKGLLVSEMHETVRDMLLNLGDMVTRFGFIPNGGRIYYLTRSQPPLFVMMVKEYVDRTGDRALLRQLLPAMEMEHRFWDERRLRKVTVRGARLELYQYWAESSGPRPESFREDVRLVEAVADEEERVRIWHDVASAAESGWDFSSRWLKDPYNLSSIETTNVLPVDLNSYLIGGKRILVDFYKSVDEPEKAARLQAQVDELLERFDRVFYDAETGVYADFNIRTQRHNKGFYPTWFTPFWSGCFEDSDARHALILERTFDRMKTVGALQFVGGVPTRLRKEGLALARKWIQHNFDVWASTSYMFEKYDATGASKAGYGGEYVVQKGFGWTNGVILDLLHAYKDVIELSVRFEPQNLDIVELHSSAIPTTAPFSPLLAMVLAALRIL